MKYVTIQDTPKFNDSMVREDNEAVIYTEHDVCEHYLTTMFDQEVEEYCDTECSEFSNQGDIDIDAMFDIWYS